MKSEGIYVELPIRTPLDKLWEYTQKPELHEQWDLRFTSIEYLPKQSDDEPQHFLYTTRIGFGIRISGQGESLGTRHAWSSETTSALRFWSDHRLSLIQTGSGYWKYIPNGDTIRFLTWYDYQTRFGILGKLFDKLVFRPILGWATAWSFDALRLWLEQGIHPAESTRRLWALVTAQLALAAIWIYQGLIPKLLFPDSGELDILRAAKIPSGVESILLTAIGVGEILFGVLFLIPLLGKPLHYLNILALMSLGLGAILSKTDLLVAPFNPVTLTIAMVALSLISLTMIEYLPSARRCLRRPLIYAVDLSVEPGS
jgi:hypothetical protein